MSPSAVGDIRLEYSDCSKAAISSFLTSVEEGGKARFGGHRAHTRQWADPFNIGSCGRPKPTSTGPFSFGGDLFHNIHFDTAAKDREIRHDLSLTLEEVFRGCVKKMKVTRNVTSSDGRSQCREQKVLTINVKPGWKAGTKIRFEREGDRLPGRVPADIVRRLEQRALRHTTEIRTRCRTGVRLVCPERKGPGVLLCPETLQCLTSVNV
ncbi:hypothetical protein HPB52_017201 [Rhipicephalus sanguineus]|uniref:Chaperone DnaJ C-terminal domain-containing protein n=1 Tax=Rhipicephalus sanguineus TaxID=34632 RepID=A0A9D4PEZ1_RHISA|nr:hypothetical protein HPB52_017201 [Rhipicephalus sanguineus]